LLLGNDEIALSFYFDGRNILLFCCDHEFLCGYGAADVCWWMFEVEGKNNNFFKNIFKTKKKKTNNL